MNVGIVDPVGLPVSNVPRELENNSVRDLLAEVHAVAHELKKASFTVENKELLQEASRSLLQSLLDHGPQTVPALARARNASRQNIQILANRLQRLGCVEFIDNPAHRKSGLVHITQNGRRALSMSADHEARLLKHLSHGLGRAEVKAARELLQQLRRTLEGNESPEAPAQPRPKAKRIKKVSPPVAEETLEDENVLPVSLL